MRSLLLRSLHLVLLFVSLVACRDRGGTHLQVFVYTDHPPGEVEEVQVTASGFGEPIVLKRSSRMAFHLRLLPGRSADLRLDYAGYGYQDGTRVRRTAIHTAHARFAQGERKLLYLALRADCEGGEGAVLAPLPAWSESTGEPRDGDDAWSVCSADAVPTDASMPDADIDGGQRPGDANVPPTCAPGYQDCVAEVPGCETHVRLDRDHCGDCDSPCELLQGCFEGRCNEVNPAWTRIPDQGEASDTVVAAADDQSIYWAGSAHSSITLGEDTEDTGDGVSTVFLARVRTADGNSVTSLDGIHAVGGGISIRGLAPEPGGRGAWTALHTGPLRDRGPSITGAHLPACTGYQCAYLLHVSAADRFSGGDEKYVTIRTDAPDASVLSADLTRLPDGTLVVVGQTSAYDDAPAALLVEGRNDTVAQLPPAGGRRWFVATVASDGEATGVVPYVLRGIPFGLVRALPGGDIVTAGHLVGPTSLQVEGEASPRMFEEGRHLLMTRIDPTNGSIRWANTFPVDQGTASDTSPSDFRALDVDDAGNIYAYATCQGDFSLGGDDIGATAGDTVVFIGSWDGSGRHRWSRSVGENLDAQRYLADPGAGLVHADGLIVFTAGVLPGSATTDLGAGALLVKPDEDNVVAALRAEDGAFVWGRLFGASEGLSLLNASARGRDVFISGTFRGTFAGETRSGETPLLMRLRLAP